MQRMLLVGLICVVVLLGMICLVLVLTQQYESAVWLAALGVTLAMMPSMLTMKQSEHHTTSGTFARIRMSRPGTRLRALRESQRSRPDERV